MTDHKTEQNRIFVECAKIPNPFGVWVDSFSAWFAQKWWTQPIDTKYIYLPINWAACWYMSLHAPFTLENGIEITPEFRHHYLATMQGILNSLNPKFQYFTVADTRHTNRLTLPETITLTVFSGGGYNATEMTSQLDIRLFPLIHGTMDYGANKERLKQKHLCFFPLGGSKHPLRGLCRDALDGKKGCLVTEKLPLENYLETLKRSMFAICPRGDAPSSFRLFEAISCGTVPIYVSDQHIFPYGNIPDFVQVVKPENINSIPELIHSFSNNQIEQMQRDMWAWSDEYLPKDNIYKRIIKELDPNKQ